MHSSSIGHKHEYIDYEKEEVHLNNLISLFVLISLNYVTVVLMLNEPICARYIFVIKSVFTRALKIWGPLLFSCKRDPQPSVSMISRILRAMLVWASGEVGDQWV